MPKVKQISVSEFKAKSLALFDVISTGKLIVIVTKRGKPVAKIEAIDVPSTNVAGKLRGSVIKEDDILSPIGPDEWLAAK